MTPTTTAAIRDEAQRILYAIPAIEGPMANPIWSSAENILRILDEAEKDVCYVEITDLGDMFCNKCGNRLINPYDGDYCPGCGRRIERG